jgi:GTP-binding protein
VHVLLTKADKLTQSERQRALAQVEMTINRPDLHLPETLSAQLFSASRKQGLEQAESVVAPWLGLAEPQNKGP